MKRYVLAAIFLTQWLGIQAACAVERTAEAGVANGYAQRLGDLINRYRQQHGLAPLAMTNDLVSIADQHTAEMAARRRLSHDGFRERFDRTNARICVENVGWNFPFPEAQLDGWRASPGHHRNLLEPKITHMGLAVSHAYVTFFACS